MRGCRIGVHLDVVQEHESLRAWKGGGGDLESESYGSTLAGNVPSSLDSGFGCGGGGLGFRKEERCGDAELAFIWMLVKHIKGCVHSRGGGGLGF